MCVIVLTCLTEGCHCPYLSDRGTVTVLICLTEGWHCHYLSDRGVVTVLTCLTEGSKQPRRTTVGTLARCPVAGDAADTPATLQHAVVAVLTVIAVCDCSNRTVNSLHPKVPLSGTHAHARARAHTQSRHP